MKARPPSELTNVLGYEFEDGTILVQALTHASAVPGGERPTYQRLEFLGDTVLGLVVADILYDTFPAADEGELSRRLAALVRLETCAEVARDIELGDFFVLGIGEEQTGGRQKEALLGDVCEAVIGAIYLDGGIEPARRFIERYWLGRVQEDSPRLKDAKTTLQEWAHAEGYEQPVYRKLGRTGPDHEPIFTISVTVGELEPAEAAGPSKRATEQAAAEALLVREGVWETTN